jgi:hypothetical protein
MSLTTHLPAQALSRFIFHAIDPEETLVRFDRIRDWINNKALS